MNPRSVPISRVSKVKYLGSILTPDGLDTSDVLTRATAAHRAFYTVPTEVWKSPRLTNKHKATLYECLVIPVLLYGAGAWTLTDASRAILTKTHSLHLRIMMNLPTFPYLDNDPMDYRQHSYDAIIAHCGAPHILSSARAERLRLFGQLRRAQESWLGSIAMILSIFYDASSDPHGLRPRGSPHYLLVGCRMRRHHILRHRHKGSHPPTHMGENNSRIPSSTVKT